MSGMISLALGRFKSERRSHSLESTTTGPAITDLFSKSQLDNFPRSSCVSIDAYIHSLPISTPVSHLIR